MGAASKTIELCRSRGISIRTLEQDLGYGNGYLKKKLISDELPFERVVAISKYFSVPVEYFVSDEETEASSQIADALALYKKYQNAIPEIQAAVDGLLKSRRHDS